MKLLLRILCFSSCAVFFYGKAEGADIIGEGYEFENNLFCNYSNPEALDASEISCDETFDFFEIPLFELQRTDELLKKYYKFYDLFHVPFDKILFISKSFLDSLKDKKGYKDYGDYCLSFSYFQELIKKYENPSC